MNLYTIYILNLCQHCMPYYIVDILYRGHTIPCGAQYNDTWERIYAGTVIRGNGNNRAGIWCNPSHARAIIPGKIASIASNSDWFIYWFT